MSIYNILYKKTLIISKLFYILSKTSITRGTIIRSIIKGTKNNKEVNNIKLRKCQELNKGYHIIITFLPLYSV